MEKFMPEYRCWDGKRMRDVFRLFWGNEGLTISFRDTENGKEPGSLNFSDERCVLMKSLGFLDFDKKIYEGDIVEIYPLKNTAVVLGVTTPNFVYVRFRDGSFGIKHVSHKSKIIGNIYENPELIHKNHR